MKKISVIIPTFNRARYISSAIRSVLAQSVQDFQIIVVDDGSTDNTKDVLNVFADRITYKYQSNAGCSAARNHGLRISSSKYVVFLDSDDLLAPRKLEIQSNILDARSEVGFIYSDSIEFDEESYYLLPAIARDIPQTFAIRHFMHPGVRSGSFMIRRTIFQKSGEFDEHMRFNEDSDFIQRLSLVSKGVFSEYPSILQRQHTSNKSRNRLEISNSLLESAYKILNRYPDFIKQVGERNVQKRIARLKSMKTQLTKNLLNKPDALFPVGERISALKQYLVIQRIKAGNLLLRRHQWRLTGEIVNEMKGLMK